MRVRAGAWVVALLLAAGAARAADAASPATEGVVVAVEKDDLVIDLGEARGVAGGDAVEIWRPLHLKHPVTGRLITDRFLIGRLRLTQVRPNLSLAAADGSLSRPAEPGDVVIWTNPRPPVLAAPSPPALASRAPAPSTPAPSPPALTSRAPAPSAPAPAPALAPAPEMVAMSEDAVDVSKLIESLRGTELAERISAYERFAAAHPHSRYGAVLLEEAAAFRRLLTAREAVTAPVDAARRPGVTAAMQPVTRVVANESLHLAAIVRGEVSGVLLHARASGTSTYETIPMSRVGDGYWEVNVPGDRVRAPALLYFVEAVAADGTSAIVGTAESPERADVIDVLPRPSRTALGQAQISTDYADFNARAANDYIFQTEGYMGARFGDVGIRAVRTGFGVYRGEGGPSVYALDTLHQAPVAIGLTYGYLETELGLARTFSFGVRGIVGLDNAGMSGGALGFLRVGSDLGTNLWAGVEGLGGIGVRGIAEFDWNAVPRWPVVFRTEVTDEPAGGDLGVRAIAQVGYRILPHLVVALRGSYQGRTISHSGPGAGGSVGYAW